EGDRPGRGGRRPAQQDDGDRGPQPDAADPRAQRGGEVLTERERVQRPAQREGDQRADGEERGDRAEDRQVPSGQGADLPEPDLLEDEVVEEDDAVGEAEQDGADRGARESEPDRGGAGAAPRAEEVDEEG